MLAAPGAADHQVTTTGTSLGSPSYMAPEQMISTRDGDARADLWSLGVILYELLTGTLPFRGPTMAALCVEVLQGSPPAPPSTLQPDVPSALDAIVARCLERDRERRVATVAELAGMLVPFADSALASASRWAEPLSSRDAGRGSAFGVALSSRPPRPRQRPR